MKEYDVKSIHWDSNIQSRLIGRGKPYPTIRILVEYIVILQNRIREAKRIHETYCEHVPNVWLEHNGTARGIEELGYKTYIEIQQFKLDEAISNLNRFRNVSDQIPELGGQVNCIIDYILYGAKWVYMEIKSNTIAERMNKENCIAYVNEAEKLIGRKFHYD